MRWISDYFGQGNASWSASVTGITACISSWSSQGRAAMYRITTTRIWSRVALPGQNIELVDGAASAMPAMYAVHANAPAAEPSEHQLISSRTDTSVLSSACSWLAHISTPATIIDFQA